MTQWGLDTLFNPAKRFMDEEKRRLQSTREEVGDNSGGRRIDLESGKVTIQRDEDAEAAESTAHEATSKHDDDELTPAQRRARERRARTRAKTKAAS